MITDLSDIAGGTCERLGTHSLARLTRSPGARSAKPRRRLLLAILLAIEWHDPAPASHARQRNLQLNDIGYAPDGKRVRKVVTGKTKQDVRDKLKSLHNELSRSVRSSRRCTIAQAVDDWLADGMDGRSAATVAKYPHALAPVMAASGTGC